MQCDNNLGYEGSLTAGTCIINSHLADGIFAESSHVSLTGCEVTGNQGDGFECILSAVAIDSCVLSNNAAHGVESSASTLSVYSTDMVNNGQSGLQTSGDSLAVIGNTAEDRCKLSGNGTYAIAVGGPGDVEARYNYWGSVDSSEIETVIFDQIDDPSKGRVHFVPFSAVPGDADGNGILNISDAVFVIVYIFGGRPPPEPLQAGDADCNGMVNVSDAVYLIVYIFGGGPEPC